MPRNDSARIDQQSFHFIIRSGLAGGVAGCVAKTVVAPLDRVKILFQASNPDFQKYAGTWDGAFRAGKAIYKDYGLLGLFQGHSATLLRIFPYAAIKFMAYDQVHHALMPTRKQETNFRRFAAGSISGAISVFFTYPLELMRVRLAYQTRDINDPGTRIRQRPLLKRVIYDIYHESKRSPPESLSGSTTQSTSQARFFARFPIVSFYRGFSVTLLGMIPYAGTSFLVWGHLRSRFLPHPPPSPSSGSGTSKPKSTPLADLTIGAIAGAVSQTVSYPFEVVRRRMQVGGLTRPDHWLGFNETVAHVWTTSGWRGFFVGLSIGYLKIVPMTAVSFTVWQWGKRILGV